MRVDMLALEQAMHLSFPANGFGLRREAMSHVEWGQRPSVMTRLSHITAKESHECRGLSCVVYLV